MGFFCWVKAKGSKEKAPLGAQDKACLFKNRALQPQPQSQGHCQHFSTNSMQLARQLIFVANFIRSHSLLFLLHSRTNIRGVADINISKTANMSSLTHFLNPVRHFHPILYLFVDLITQECFVSIKKRWIFIDTIKVVGR